MAAVAIDYAGPAWLTRERLRGLQQVAVAHFAERYSLFIIICLGESIVAIGVGASEPGARRRADRCRGARPADHGRAVVDVLRPRSPTIAEERLRAHDDPVLAAADGYSYLHLVLVAGIIVFAVGAKGTVAHAGDPLSDAQRLALCGGVALYLAGHAAFGLRITGTLSRAKLAAAAACLVVFALGLPAWATAALLTAVLAVLVAAETVAPRMPPPPSESP